MVIWRLKKLLPVAPASLRLATISQHSSNGTARLLVLVGVERALAALESVFESLEVSLGIITPRIFALANGRGAPSPMLLIQQESTFLSLLLLVDDAPHVVRTKPLASCDWQTVERELNLTLGFIEANFGMTSGLSVGLSVEDDALDRQLRGWAAASSALTPVTTALPALAFEATAVRDRAGDFRLDPAVTVLFGGPR
jgi:hypothetical protein